MNKVISIFAIGLLGSSLCAMPDKVLRSPRDTASKTQSVEKTNLYLRKLDVAEITTGKIFIFEFGSDHRLKEVVSGDSFIGVKKNDSKVVDIYVDQNKLPLTIASQLKGVDSSMPLKERVKVGRALYPSIFKVMEDDKKIVIEFKNSPIEIGSTD